MNPLKKPFALCVDNTGYEASLIPGKVYQIIPAANAAKDDLIRIVDESGEDYLYPKSHFALVDLPKAVANRILDLAERAKRGSRKRFERAMAKVRNARPEARDSSEA